MNKHKLTIVLILLAFVIASVHPTSAYAATSDDILPQLPSLSLRVDHSPLPVYPPIMIFTATLSRLPSDPAFVLRVDFFKVTSGNCGGSTQSTCNPGLVLLGSAPVDRYGKAVISRQMNPGGYTVVARCIYNQYTIWSNQVLFQIP